MFRLNRRRAFDLEDADLAGSTVSRDNVAPGDELGGLKRTLKINDLLIIGLELR